MKSLKEAVITFFNEREELIAIAFRDHKSGKAICFKVEELGTDGIAELFADATNSRKELSGSKGIMNQPKRVIDMESGEDKR